MKFEDLKRIYIKKEKQLGSATYKHISELLTEAKKLHKQDWLKQPTQGGDHEQSWRAFKGKNLEKLIQYIITKEIEGLGLKVVNGNKLERSKNLPKELSQVKRNLAIDYGEFGLHLPDVDIIIYHPKSCKVIAVISSKVTLRERIAQTGYWKLKLLQDEATQHIRVYFITPDEDRTLTYKKPPKKGRAIVEVDLDGSYVLTKEKIEESDKVKLFEHFIADLKKLLEER
ncbi:DNA modification methylase [candidate division WOR-3 bacterium]|nr:DNA modification methylase [candidate division WOR-3 bacterium]